MHVSVQYLLFESEIGALWKEEKWDILDDDTYCTAVSVTALQKYMVDFSHNINKSAPRFP